MIDVFGGYERGKNIAITLCVVLVMIMLHASHGYTVRKSDLTEDGRMASPHEADENLPQREKRAVLPLVAEKVMEVASQAIDRQIETMHQQQKETKDFVNQEIELDLEPDKGWETESMVVPPGMHISSKVTTDVEEDKEPEEEVTSGPIAYPFGVGGLLMNGCFGQGYAPGDPCYEATWKTDACLNMIDGAAFIGVGFDGRGEYSPESRKISIVQRSCASKNTYDGYNVPDTMRVHGTYDTSGSLDVFYSRSEYQHYLQQQAGIGGSVLGFSFGVRKAWGGSSAQARQTYMAVFDINIDRYEIFLDNVSPDDMSLSFLREFMELPSEYFSQDSPAKYQNFIQRWGTHYIKASRFGGQLEIRKTMEAEEAQSKSEFVKTMGTEFKSFFMSFNSKSGTEKGSSAKSQEQTSSTSFSVQGGNHDIALLIADAYSPTIKYDLQKWFESIPAHPKAFKFTIAPITELVNFKADALFPAETVHWACEGHKDKLIKENDSERMYYTIKINGTVTKKYCDYLDRLALTKAIESKRESLQIGIDVYLEEGPVSASDFSLPAGKPGCQSQNYKFQTNAKRPTWEDMTEKKSLVKVVFDMKHSLTLRSKEGQILQDQELFLRFQDMHKQWIASDHKEVYHLYDGCASGGSGNVKASVHKVCIRGLVLTYDEVEGTLELRDDDFNLAKDIYEPVPEEWKGIQLARVEWTMKDVFSMREVVGYLPCNVKWSNVLRFRTESGGKCLHFRASSKGTIFVIFSGVPADAGTWYYFEISPSGAGIFKAQRLAVSTVDPNAVSLGDETLYEGYFVCVTETKESTILEYGKVTGTGSPAEMFLRLEDTDKPQRVRYYAFGNGEFPAEVVDAHVFPRASLDTECKGDTYKDEETNLCTQKCHELCEPAKGCRRTSGQQPLPTECSECRYAKIHETGECVADCPENYKFDKESKLCFKVDGCKVYKLLDEPDRLTWNNEIQDKCDNDLEPGWYRFSTNMGVQIPTKCVPSNRCGTEAPGWLDGEHPTAQKTANVKVCYNVNGECCAESDTITVSHCEDFFVYYLKKAPKCNLRYCSTKEPDGCRSYKILNEIDRDRENTDQTEVRCDNNLQTDWYRFSKQKGIRMPNKCVPEKRCATQAPGWLNGNHPDKAEGVVTREVCYHSGGDCCKFKNEIFVQNCGDFFVYLLMKTPACTLRYCSSYPAGFSLYFPRQSTTDYVIVREMPSLQAFTVCSWMRIPEDKGSIALLSYAVKENHNEMLIENPKKFYVLLRGDSLPTSSSVSVHDFNWHHFCLTWENGGSWYLYKDGALGDSGWDFLKGQTIRGGGALVLGQEQDSVGGEFDSSQSYVGYISGMNLWNRMLTKEKIFELSRSCNAGEGNVLKWSDLKSAPRSGSVKVIQPSTCNIYRGKENEKDFSFLFSRQSTTDYVIVWDLPFLQAFTLCSWTRLTEDKSNIALFSYAVKEKDNEILFENPKKFVIVLRGVHLPTSSSVSAHDFNWHHFCLSWENNGGSWYLYKDGALGDSGWNFLKGQTIRGGGALVLGQEQDSVGGGFDSSQSYVGYISGMNLWNRALTKEEIYELSRSCSAGEGNVLKWSDLKSAYRNGLVKVIQPSTCKE